MHCTQESPITPQGLKGSPGTLVAHSQRAGSPPQRRLLPAPTIAFRSTNAISVVSQYPFRHVQIIARLYKSPAEVLMGFDVDSCSVGYDGGRLDPQ